MANEPSKFAENQFLSGTVGRLSLMDELLAYTSPRLALAASADADFDPVNDLITETVQNWHTTDTLLANALAARAGATVGLEDKLASLTRKPDADTNSPVETWDNVIRSAVAYQGPIYTVLLPQGRATITAGTIEQRLDALKDFAVRLSQQTTKPALVTLGATVMAFSTAAKTLRANQQELASQADRLSDDLEACRVQAAAALYAMVGFAMWKWRATPERVDTLFSVSLLRGPAQVAPAAPGDTAWAPATHTLSTTALPEGATRLEAWRLAPGGAPERIATGETDEPLVVIPPTILFTPAVVYQLWLVAKNSQGPSPAGPVQTWTA